MITKQRGLIRVDTEGDFLDCPGKNEAYELIALGTRYTYVTKYNNSCTYAPGDAEEMHEYIYAFTITVQFCLNCGETIQSA